MRKSTLALVVTNALLFAAGVGLLLRKAPQEQYAHQQAPHQSPISNQPVLPPLSYKISDPKPSYLNYKKTVAKMKEWAREAPELSEVFSYGKSSDGEELYCIKLSNKRVGKTAERPRVLITACIHGNEPLAASTVMWYIGAMLDQYGKENEFTALMDSREVYFVPVVSPDSYPNSRFVDGVDPNRNFPTASNPGVKSAPPVAALQELFMSVKPAAVISGHTWGRVYLVPPGDRMENSPRHEDYERVVGKMAKLSGYRWMRACDMYKKNGGLNNPPVKTIAGVPIYGSEVDWYERHGSFSVVMEFGTHQRVPSDQDIRVEFEHTFRAFLHFLREAPLAAKKA